MEERIKYGWKRSQNNGHEKKREMKPRKTNL